MVNGLTTNKGLYKKTDSKSWRVNLFEHDSVWGRSPGLIPLEISLAQRPQLTVDAEGRILGYDDSKSLLDRMGTPKVKEPPVVKAELGKARWYRIPII